MFVILFTGSLFNAVLILLCARLYRFTKWFPGLLSINKKKNKLQLPQFSYAHLLSRYKYGLEELSTSGIVCHPSLSLPSKLTNQNKTGSSRSLRLSFQNAAAIMLNYPRGPFITVVLSGDYSNQSNDIDHHRGSCSY